jgi:hypothetical protein
MPRLRLGSLPSTVGPLAIYTVLSVAYFGRALLHGDRDFVGQTYDPQLFIWSLGWWPHAVLDGGNPFVTHAMWPATGVNLAWVTSVPGLAFVAAPLTLTAGPVTSYNVLAVALPALAAWTAFLLCRYLSGSWWPSLAGGYLFGFSSYMLGQTRGHMHMTAVLLVPLVALVVLKYVHGRVSRRGLALWLGLLLGAQFWLSTELFATVTLVLAGSMLVAYLVVPDVRARLRDAVAPIVGAYVIGCLVSAPLLVYALLDFNAGAINDPALFPADLLNVVVPTEVTHVGGGRALELSRRFLGNSLENGAYLGLPLLVIVGWFAWQNRSRPSSRLLVVLLACGIVASLGVALRVGGDRVVPLPWALVVDLPGLGHVLPVRFSMYVSLAAAVVAALWAASPRPAAWVRTALLAGAVVALLPAVQRDLWQTTPMRPSFFADDTYRVCFRPDETVFIPAAAGKEATLWQVESGYRFRLANGSLSPELPKKSPDLEAAYAVLNDAIPEGGGQRVVRLARALGSTVILLDPEDVSKWAPALREAGVRGFERGGIWLYPLRPLPASCT